MSQSEAYTTAESRGWDAANYAVAYENAPRDSAAPEPKEHDPSLHRFLTSPSADEQTQQEARRGFEAGWNRYMNQDYPE